MTDFFFFLCGECLVWGSLVHPSHPLQAGYYRQELAMHCVQSPTLQSPSLSLSLGCSGQRARVSSATSSLQGSLSRS